MNRSILLGLIRHTLTTVGGVLVTRGLLTTADLDAIAGGLAVLAGVLWSILEKRRRSP
jgi:hypothetical protein